MLVVNLFGGPGSGKSTLMAATFAELKMRSVCAEMAPEYAKELVWGENYLPLGNQLHVTGEQAWRIHRAAQGGTDVVITDSPVLLGLVYAPPEQAEDLTRVLHREHERFPSLNYTLRRDVPYDPRGRRQCADSARDVDTRISRVLAHLGIYPETLASCWKSASFIATDVEAKLAEIRRGA